jgi:alpha-glucosidase
LPILSSTNTSDLALLEARYIISHMLPADGRVLEALASNEAKVVIMAYDEFTTDLPEQRNMKPAVYWDSRARGLGGLTCSGAEENLLCFPGDPYSTENILIHEFAHTIHEHAMPLIDPTFRDATRACLQSGHGARTLEEKPTQLPTPANIGQKPCRIGSTIIVTMTLSTTTFTPWQC